MTSTEIECCRKGKEKIKRGGFLMLSSNLTKQSLSITIPGEKQKRDNRRQQIWS